MPAVCSTCDTAAGPTIRIQIAGIEGQHALSLTIAQALDLEGRLVQALAQLGIDPDPDACP